MSYKLGLIFLFGFLSIQSSTGQNGLSWFDAASTTDDSYRGSPAQDCMIIDDITASDKSPSNIKFHPRQFFVYTNPQVRKYMKDEHLMECLAYVNKVEENHFLILEYKINSDKAKINYGNLEKGGKIKVKLMNKDHLYLENIERSRGKVKRSDKHTTYIGTYAINKSNIGMLKKQNIDKITVLWEEGVEEYEVQNIDLVRNQLHHLSNL